MAIQPTDSKIPFFQLDIEHAEVFCATIFKAASSPIQRVGFYFFPCLGAFLWNYTQIRKNDPAQSAMLPELQRKAVLQEIESLATKAGIQRNLSIYTTLNNSFSHLGSTFSLTPPVLLLPIQHIRTFLDEEKSKTKDPVWNYSDNEMRFLIARQIGGMVSHREFLGTFLKIGQIAFYVLFCTIPSTQVLFIAASFGAHLYLERQSEETMDLLALEILTKAMGSEEKARESALSALEKMRRQNILRREKSNLCQLYITESGDNLLDFSAPSLSKRIRKIRSSH